MKLLSRLSTWVNLGGLRTFRVSPLVSSPQFQRNLNLCSEVNS